MSFCVRCFSAGGSSGDRTCISSIEFNAETDVSGFVSTIDAERTAPSAAHVHLRINVERDRRRDSGQLFWGDIDLESGDLGMRRGNESDIKSELQVAMARGKDSYELSIFQLGPHVKMQVEY